MKLTRDKVQAMLAFCRSNKINYVTEGSYESAVRCAIKGRQRTHDGVLIYFPRRSVHRGFKRAYIIWSGEPIDLIETACAHILMASDATQLYLVRRSKHSKAAQEIERVYEQENEPRPLV